MALHPGVYDHRAEGFGDIVHRAGQQSLLLVLDIRETGNQNHRDILRDFRGLQLLEDHKAIHVRHNDIQKHQGELPVPGRLQAIPAGLADYDFKFVAQDGAQIFALHNTVVDHQYFVHNRSLPPLLHATFYFMRGTHTAHRGCGCKMLAAPTGSTRGEM